MFLVVVLIMLAAIFYKWATNNNLYFAKRGILHEKPVLCFGTTYNILLKKTGVAQMADKVYNKYPNEKFVGIFNARQPIYFLRDLELIRQVYVKDFNYFTDRASYIGETSDEIYNNLFLHLKSEKWRMMRTTISAAFTVNKMKQMFELMSEVANDSCKFLKEKSAANGSVDYEIKDLFSRYAADIIATCAFGHKVDSMRNEKNEFFQAGQALHQFVELRALGRSILIRLMPKCMGLQMLEPKLSGFLTKMVVGTMDIRQKENIFRPDILNLFMQVRQERTTNKHNETVRNDSQELLHKWKDIELVGQCLTFYFAGYQTVSTVLSFTAFELATNPHVQNRLYDEVREMNEQLDGKSITYEALNGLVYLDQVLNESLRMWPATPTLRRRCTKDYSYTQDSTKLHIEKGIFVLVPVYSIQRDPKYWPDPEKFDPDRFSSANKSKIISGSHLAFGIGPRNCIGLRFAMIELKVIFYNLILNFELLPNDRTQIPIKLKKTILNIAPEGGIHLTLKPRSKN